MHALLSYGHVVTRLSTIPLSTKISDINCVEKHLPFFAEQDKFQKKPTSFTFIVILVMFPFASLVDWFVFRLIGWSGVFLLISCSFVRLIDWLIGVGRLIDRFVISIDWLLDYGLIVQQYFLWIMSQFLRWKKSKLDLAVGRRAHLVEHGRSRYRVERTRGIRKLKYFFFHRGLLCCRRGSAFRGLGGGVFDHFVHIIIHNPTIIALLSCVCVPFGGEIRRLMVIFICR